MTTTNNTTSTTATETTITETTSASVKSTVIRPGWLVSVNTKLSGGVEYRRIALDASGEPAQPGAEVTKWETIKTVIDPVEYERATKTRSKARSLITKVCHGSAFGDLCPEDQIGGLDAAAREADRLIAEFNATAKHSKISMFVLKGHVASDDASAARAITAELASLVVDMKAGIETFDAESIREAADRARELSAMLDDSQKTKIDGAIAQARKAAREITKRITKNGEDKATVLLDIQRGQIESARIAFLDMSEALAAPAEALPAIEAQRFADLDVTDDDTSGEAEPVKAPSPTLDLAEGSEPVRMAAPSAVRFMEVA
jgi:vacuolar-type H+-ATPase subunit H